MTTKLPITLVAPLVAGEASDHPAVYSHLGVEEHGRDLLRYHRFPRLSVVATSPASKAVLPPSEPRWLGRFGAGWWSIDEVVSKGDGTDGSQYTVTRMIKKGDFMPEASAHVRSGKARFDHVYNLADPRGYFQTLRDFEYQAPAHGERVFARLVQRRREHLDREDVVVLDLCCSYGINAALLNHDLTLDKLYTRYGSLELASLSTDELVAADRTFYDEHRRPHPARVVGIDVADQAVAYAQRVGLQWAGSSENLETRDPSAALARRLTGVDLITVTGGIGYITERTFGRVLERASAGDGCWVASFVLRWIPYERIARVLAQYGLATEQLSGHTFRQRRFADDTERDYVLGQLESMGIDPTGKETDGWYHSNFYFSRLVGDDLPPLSELLSGCID